jgi:DNA-binding CsgD family transcriptional regulator/tetratricopeptide (TPR) repeat protein
VSVGAGLATARVDGGRHPSSAEASFERLSSPILIGRERELELLVEAATRRPAFAVVEGEAGIGKTRLVQELLDDAGLTGRPRYVGACLQLGEPFPLGPVVEALRDARLPSRRLRPVVGALRPLLPELATRLPEAPEPLGDRRAERHRLFRAVRELLCALGTAVVVLEDLHWADDATVELLSFLVPQLPPELTLICTYRREDLPERSPLLGLSARLPGTAGGAHIALQPLDRGQARDMISSILETDELSTSVADYLFEGSGGLPFALEELLRVLRDRSDVLNGRQLLSPAPLEEMGVPRALRDSILERLERLAPDARRVVQAAAVLSAPAAEQDLVDVAGLSGDRIDEVLAEALSSALLIEVRERVYGFRHVLARQAVEDAVPSPVRRRLHLRAARVLERAPAKPLARLAHHHRAAGRTKEWIRCAEAAADRATSLEDDATAYRFLKEAVAVPGLPAATRARLAVKLASHARYCLAHGEAIEILRRVLREESLSAGTRGEVRLWLARLLIQDGENEAAYDETTRALPDLGRRPALAAEAMVLLALPWVTGGGGPLEKQFEWLDRAVETAARSSKRAVRISVAADRATLLLYAADPKGWDAVAAIPEPGPGSDELKQAVRGSGNLADALLHLGHYRRAEEFIADGLGLLANSGLPPTTAALKLTKLQLDWVQGAWEGLEDRARFYMETWGDWAAVKADAQAVLGVLLLAQGDVHAPQQLLEPLRDDFRGEGPVLSWVAGALARIRLAEGRPEAALDNARPALEAVRTKGIWLWAAEVAPYLVKGLAEAGREREAEELTAEFAAGLAGRDAPAAAAALMLCRAQLAETRGDRDAAAELFLQAEQAWRALPRPYEAAKAAESAAICRLDGGGRGREMLLEARTAFHDLGAAWDEARVRRTLREHGVIVPYRGGRKGYGRNLSPRETEVARLACEGLSNPEIAVALFLSRKTVERHLSSAMRKLSVTSRWELPERLGVPDAKLTAHS